MSWLSDTINSLSKIRNKVVDQVAPLIKSIPGGNVLIEAQKSIDRKIQELTGDVNAQLGQDSQYITIGGQKIDISSLYSLATDSSAVSSNDPIQTEGIDKKYLYIGGFVLIGVILLIKARK